MDILAFIVLFFLLFCYFKYFPNEKLKLKIPESTDEIWISLMFLFKLLHSPGNHCQMYSSDSGAALVNSDLVKAFKDVARRKRARTGTSKSIVISLNPLICTKIVELQLCSTRSSSNAVLLTEQRELYYH